MNNESTSRVPSTKELLNPTLEAIHDLGANASIADVANRVKDLLVLPPDVTNIPHGNEKRTELEYRLAWARTYLRMYGLIENSGRGTWSLTTLGLNVRHVDPDEVARAAFQRNTKRTVGERVPAKEARSETESRITSASTISDLKAAIGRLETEKRRIEKQHRALVTTLQYFENPELMAEPPAELSSSPIPTQGYLESSERVLPARRPRTTELSDSTMRDTMSEILGREGPLHRSVIHDRLVEMGVRIRGRNPVNNVGAHLSIDPRFKNVGRGMWDLSEPDEDPAEPEQSGADREGEEDSIAW